MQAGPRSNSTPPRPAGLARSRRPGRRRCGAPQITDDVALAARRLRSVERKLRTWRVRVVQIRRARRSALGVLDSYAKSFRSYMRNTSCSATTPKRSSPRPMKKVDIRRRLRHALECGHGSPVDPARPLVPRHAAKTVRRAQRRRLRRGHGHRGHERRLRRHQRLPALPRATTRTRTRRDGAFAAKSDSLVIVTPGPWRLERMFTRARAQSPPSRFQPDPKCEDMTEDRFCPSCGQSTGPEDRFCRVAAPRSTERLPRRWPRRHPGAAAAWSSSPFSRCWWPQEPPPRSSRPAASSAEKAKTRRTSADRSSSRPPRAPHSPIRAADGRS